MSSKKNNPKLRKSFKLQKDSPLCDSMYDMSVASSGELPVEQGTLNEGDLNAHQLEMVRQVLAFNQLAWRGFKTVLFSILFFGVGTSVSGGLFGYAFPEYCRFVFDAFDRVDFKPWIGGLAHGLVCGSIAGAIIGCIVVFSVAIYQSQTWRNINKDRSESQ